MIGFYRVVGVLLDVVPRRGAGLSQHAGIDRRGVGDHLVRDHLERAQRPGISGERAGPSAGPAVAAASDRIGVLAATAGVTRCRIPPRRPPPPRRHGPPGGGPPTPAGAASPRPPAPA